MMRIIETTLLYGKFCPLPLDSPWLVHSLRLVDRQSVKVPRQLPPLIVRQSRPRWHSVCQIAVRQQPMQFTVGRLVHPRDPKAGTPANTPSVASMTGGATPLVEDGPGGNGVRVYRVGVNARPLLLRDTLQPCPGGRCKQERAGQTQRN